MKKEGKGKEKWIFRHRIRNGRSNMMHAPYSFSRGTLRHSDERVLPVMKKEGKGKEKWIFRHRMRNGRSNLCSFWAQTNGRSCVLKLSFLFASTLSAIHYFDIKTIAYSNKKLWTHQNWVFCSNQAFQSISCVYLSVRLCYTSLSFKTKSFKVQLFV